jgi:RNA polymerase sigma-70 factor, ECF subfamily
MAGNRDGLLGVIIIDVTDEEATDRSDGNLVLQARQGDQAAWEELVRRYQTPVYRIAYLILGDPEASQDVAQETFIRAYRNLDRFDIDRPLRPWLLRISSNQARNARRSLRRYWSALNKSAEQHRLDPVKLRSVEENRSGIAEDVWRSIRRLSPDDQQIIYLRYFLELSVVEAASTLDIPEGTVKSRLHRALDRLKSIMELENSS